MAKIVANVALSHAPGLTGWLDHASPEEQENLQQGFTKLGTLLRATEPDIIIGLANDHVLNLPLNNTPDYCIGTAERWHGPAEWFREWLNVPDYSVPGHSDLAKTLIREGDNEGIRFAFSEDLLFDDNWSVPLYYLTPDYDIPLVPIHMNCIVPPLPTPDDCYELGRRISRIITQHRPDDERIAFMATGGLSHDPGGERYFDVDEEFDRWFLDLLNQGNPDKVLKEVTIDKMKAAGDGGTSELLAWIAAFGVADGASAEIICYEPAVELRCGMGCVRWDMAS